MRALKCNLLSTTVLPVFVGAGIAVGGALAVAASGQASAANSPDRGLLPMAQARPAAMQLAACNPCAAKKACNPCAAKACNPCAAKKACNPCAAKACNPCAAKACNPCAAKACNPCAAKACNPCNPCGGAAASVSEKCIVPRLQVAALNNPCAAKACNPCAAKKACNPCAAKACNPCAAKACNPCAAKKACNPCAAKACNPCAAKACNPCAAKKACNPCAAKACNPCAAKACNPCAVAKACNPCAAKKACNPCAAKACNPCAAKNPCNPCAAANPCNPCGGAPVVKISDAEARVVYDCLRTEMKAAYAKVGMDTVAGFMGWSNVATVPYQSDTHGGRYVNNYVNKNGAYKYAKFEEAGAMPADTVIAKDSFTVRPDGRVAVGPLFVMHKMPGNFNAASGDWRYTMVMPDGSVMGTTKGDGDGNVAFCNTCHEAVAEDQDYMFFLPEEYRVSN